jgi:hypothetical protein
MSLNRDALRLGVLGRSMIYIFVADLDDAGGSKPRVRGRCALQGSSIQADSARQNFNRET